MPSVDTKSMRADQKMLSTATPGHRTSYIDLISVHFMSSVQGG